MVHAGDVMRLPTTRNAIAYLAEAQQATGKKMQKYFEPPQIL
jgi:hypothetical protein